MEEHLQHVEELRKQSAREQQQQRAAEAKVRWLLKNNPDLARDVARHMKECKEKGEPKIGMREHEVRATCWHGPQHVNTTTTAHHQHIQMVFIEGYVYLEDGVVTAIQQSHQDLETDL
jgi:hypothetical protein